jgi:hypothetical protein
MAKNAGRLAGLAALGAAAYMMSRGKDTKGPSATADEEKSSKARTAAQKDAVSGNRTAKDEDYSNEGYKKPEIKNEPKSAPVVKREVKSEVIKDAKADKVGDPSQSRGVLRSDRDTVQDKPLYKQEGVTIGGVEKRTEGNKPMPSLAAVERKAAARKASISTDEMKNRSRAQAAHIAKMKRLKANPESQALEASNPELFLTPGGGAKTAANLAKNLANRNVVSKAPEYSTPLLTAPAKQLTGPSKADLLARDRAAREAARQKEMLRENARRSGLDPDNMNPAVANKVRQNMGGDDFSLGMKRGGMTKMASGDMTASRRGDGIATRGKTKCKMY